MEQKSQPRGGASNQIASLKIGIFCLVRRQFEKRLKIVSNEHAQWKNRHEASHDGTTRSKIKDAPIKTILHMNQLEQANSLDKFIK